MLQVRRTVRAWLGMGVVTVAWVLHAFGLHHLEGGLLDQAMPVVVEWLRVDSE